MCANTGGFRVYGSKLLQGAQIRIPITTLGRVQHLVGRDSKHYHTYAHELTQYPSTTVERALRPTNSLVFISTTRRHS